MREVFNNNQSVKARFIATLSVNIARIGLGFIAGIIIARSLTPAGYGNYSFLLGSFSSIPALISMGTPQAFYTFISQKRHGLKFYIYYLSWIAIQFILVLLFIGVIFPDTWRNKVWLGHAKGIIILAFSASFMMNRLWEVVTQAGESIRATVIVQLYNISIVGLYLCVVSVMAFLHCLTISNLFIISAFIYFLAFFLLSVRLRDKLVINEDIKLSKWVNDFKAYCSPLIAYNIVSFLYAFSNLWLLQRFGGSVQQGFYNVGLRFSAICLIATTSILAVFWKEIAEANKSGDKERLYYLYKKTSRGLCFAGAMGASLFIPFSREILVFLLGPKYEAGWFSLAVMFLYPIHQSLGQINASYFYATAQTRLYSKVQIIIMIISMPATYLVLASRSSIIPGLALGSAGLALKTVISQIIAVNLLAFFICKTSGWRFNFLYQFVSMGVLLIASFAIKGFFSWVFQALNISLNPLALMAFCMPINILAIGLIIYSYPELSGLEKGQLRNVIYFLRKNLSKKAL